MTPCWVTDSFEFVTVWSNRDEIFKVDLVGLFIELEQKLNISLSKVLAVFDLTKPL